MPSFDIITLTEFHPPVARCWLCLALWPAELMSQFSFRCPGCNSLYQSQTVTVSGGTSIIGQGPLPPGAQEVSSLLWSPVYPAYTLDTGLGRRISIGDEPMAHAMELARLAVELRDASGDNPPLRALMNLLLASRSFIHVTSFNFDEFTLALLEMAAQRTSIAATFSGVDPKRRSLLEQVEVEAPSLEYRVEGTKADIGDQNHGKLIVIDGLLAIIGSPNLTRPAWRKAAANMEIVEVVSEVSRVADLNNRYFSPLWWRLQPNIQPRYRILNWTIITSQDAAQTGEEDAASHGSEGE
jgi:hypothetical protein